jgi:hypothetical protein
LTVFDTGATLVALVSVKSRAAAARSEVTFATDRRGAPPPQEKEYQWTGTLPAVLR